MLTITKEQIDAFKEDALRRFKKKMLVRVKEVASAHFQFNGEEAARNLVDYGMQRAGEHGFTEQDTLRLYLDFTVIYGCDFDVDPQLPWAARVLGSKRDEDELIKSQRLYVLGRSYDQEVSGLENEHADEAMASLRSLPVQGFLTPGMAIKGQLFWIFPRKFDYLGEEGVDGLLQRGKELAQQYGLEPDLGAAALAILMFLFGWGFCQDPQYPWATATLNDPALNPAQRLEALCKQTQDYLTFIYFE